MLIFICIDKQPLYQLRDSKNSLEHYMDVYLCHNQAKIISLFDAFSWCFMFWNHKLRRHI